ncbi:unnamed protein product [Phytomonas sp. Hart1]|nr:unnamed protein product [Phytomonas sp. Hart1]|eukprot:CCW71700.1 unnamed protein product [Phytomonas sp. isolate Hart1]
MRGLLASFSAEAEAEVESSPTTSPAAMGPWGRGNHIAAWYAEARCMAAIGRKVEIEAMYSHLGKVLLEDTAAASPAGLTQASSFATWVAQRMLRHDYI